MSKRSTSISIFSSTLSLFLILYLSLSLFISSLWLSLSLFSWLSMFLSVSLLSFFYHLFMSIFFSLFTFVEYPTCYFAVCSRSEMSHDARGSQEGCFSFLKSKVLSCLVCVEEINAISGGKGRQDKTRQVKTRQDKTRQDKTRQDKRNAVERLE